MMNRRTLVAVVVSLGWGIDGYLTTCRIAQSMLSKTAADAVRVLPPNYADNDLGSLCSWEDRVKFVTTGHLPFITWIHQILSATTSITLSDNLTEALLFLSHYMGDIHQPLHVGFTSDRGANTIDVHWYKRKTVLHPVWDASIIETSEERFYNSNADDLIDAIQKNITVHT